MFRGAAHKCREISRALRRNDLLARVGLDDLLAKGGLPESATPPGTDLGPLAPEAVGALGLGPGCRVAAGLVDAHAGALAVLGGRAARSGAAGHAALITGTSNSLMLLARERRGAPGMWGPYFGAVMPGHWITEGGQSASGALLDHLIQSHPAGGAPTAGLRARIDARLEEMLERDGPDMAAGLIVLPDMHGNRTPFGDPRARGAIVGMPLDESFDGLCRLYWRGAVGIAFGIRLIAGALKDAGMPVRTMHMAGGQAISPLLRGLYADATGRAVESSAAPDSMLLGAAMVAAAAAGIHDGIAAAAGAMEQERRERREPAGSDPFRASYGAFRELQVQFLSHRAMAVAALPTWREFTVLDDYAVESLTRDFAAPGAGAPDAAPQAERARRIAGTIRRYAADRPATPAPCADAV